MHYGWQTVPCAPAAWHPPPPQPQSATTAWPKSGPVCSSMDVYCPAAVLPSYGKRVGILRIRVSQGR
jgi:hypothetical protein